MRTATPVLMPTACRRTGTSASRTGGLSPTPGDPEGGDVEAQDPDHGAVGHDGDRSGDLPPAAVGRDGEFSQRVHGRTGAQGAIVAHLQILGDIHQRFGCNGAAVPIVEVDGEANRVGARVHQGQRGVPVIRRVLWLTVI